MDLTKFDRVEWWFGGQNFNFDWTAWLTAAIKGISQEVETSLRRFTQVVADREAFIDVRPGESEFFLKGYPVTSIANIWNDPDRDYGSSDIIDPTDYALYPEDGLVVFDFGPIAGARSVKVQYTGGMAADVDAFIEAFPDLVQAIDGQLIHNFQHKDDLGLTDTDGGEVAAGARKFFLFSWVKQHGLMLPSLVQAIRRERSMVRRW